MEDASKTAFPKGDVEAGTEKQLTNEIATELILDVGSDSETVERVATSMEVMPTGYAVLSAAEFDDRELLHKTLETSLGPNGTSVYGGCEALLANGFAVLGVHTASGAIVCAGTSYSMSDSDVEVSISTLPEHRGKGLATAVAARFVHDSLVKHKCAPHWTASNPHSLKIADRLGFKYLSQTKCFRWR